MTAVVFAGPSLAGGATAPAGVVLAGPAMAGDVYRAARDGARTIGLVDGVFEDRPTVWHKEILWALERGVRVLGAASLGALRAAECAPFGMEGVGRIYEQVRDGMIADDSDVAVTHAPEALGWQPLTEARVNVRATLAAAAEQGALPRRVARAIAARAEALPFRELTWRALLDGSEPQARFAAWLPQGRVDLKRSDALALLDAVAAGGDAPRAGFRLAETRYWRAAVAWFEQRGATPEEESVLDELRLDPGRFERAVLRAFARRAAAGEPPDPAQDEGALLDDLRLRHGLGTAAEFRAWLGRMRTRPGALAAAMADEDRLAAALDRSTAELLPAVLDALRVDGRFEPLALRAADKRSRLAGRPAAAYRETELGGLVADLCARRRVAIDAEDADVAARALGLEDRRALFRLLADERDYARMLAEDGE